MKRILWVCLLAVPVLAMPGRVQAWGWCIPPLEIDAGINARFNVHALDWSTIAQTGPWYLYFPYDAHLQTAGPVHPYPNWPGQMTLPPPPGARPAPAGPVLPTPTAYFQPVGYYYSSMPAYWYGR